MTEARGDDAGAPALRASDADRDRFAAALRDHLVAGRLTLDEFSERVGAAHDARTLAELEALSRDLPAHGSAELDVPPRPPTRWSVAIMGGVERRSRWRLAGRTTALAIMGGCELDLRQAEIEGPQVEITAVAIMGGIEIVVPEGVEVDVTGIAVAGGKSDRVKDVPRLPGSPLIRVRAFALMGGVEVVSKPTGRLRSPLPPPPPVPPVPPPPPLPGLGRGRDDG